MSRRIRHRGLSPVATWRDEATSWSQLDADPLADLEQAVELMRDMPYRLPEFLCPLGDRMICLGEYAYWTHIEQAHPEAYAGAVAYLDGELLRVNAEALERCMHDPDYDLEGDDD